MEYHTNCPIVWWSESYLVPSPGWEAPPQAMGRSASRSRDGAASNGKDKGGDGKRDLALGISGFHGRFMVVLLGDWMVITSQWWFLMVMNGDQSHQTGDFHQNRHWYRMVSSNLVSLVLYDEPNTQSYWKSLVYWWLQSVQSPGFSKFDPWLSCPLRSLADLPRWERHY